MVVISIRQAGNPKPQVKVEELRTGQAGMPPRASDGACERTLYI